MFDTIRSTVRRGVVPVGVIALSVGVAVPTAWADEPAEPPTDTTAPTSTVPSAVESSVPPSSVPGSSVPVVAVGVPPVPPSVETTSPTSTLSGSPRSPERTLDADRGAALSPHAQLLTTLAGRRVLDRCR